jgi:hypothetical protein
MTARWALKAAEDIFDLFKNASYFGTKTAEHKRQMLEGWAQIIERNAAITVTSSGHGRAMCTAEAMNLGGMYAAEPSPTGPAELLHEALALLKTAVRFHVGGDEMIPVYVERTADGWHYAEGEGRVE